MVGTTLPAVVRVVDLPVGTTVTGAELFEVVQTSAGVGQSVQLSLNQLNALVNIPTGGATGTILNKSSGANYSTQWSNITQFVAIGTSLSTTGSATSIVAFVANQGITSTQIANNAVGTNQVASSLGIASSLSIGTLLTVGGTATVTGTTILNGGLQVTGTTLLTGVTGVVGTSQFTGAFNVVGTSLLTGLFGVVGTSQFTGAFNVVGTTLITGTLGVVGTSTFTGTLNIIGTSSIGTATGSSLALSFGTNTTGGNLSVSWPNAGAPASSGTVDANVAVRFNVQSVVYDFGVYAGGTIWKQARLISNLATNEAIALNPNGGGVAIGTAGITGNTVLAVQGTTLVTGTLGIVGTSLLTGALVLGNATTGIMWSSATGVISATTNIATGLVVTVFNAGNATTGTITPSPLNGNYQYLTNNGAFTLAAYTTFDFALDILIQNGTAPGAITFSGWRAASVATSAFTTTARAIQSAVIATGSPGIVTVTAHLSNVGDPVWFSTSSALPTGMSSGLIYYISTATANTLQIATTPGTTVSINLSGTQAGTHTATFPSQYLASLRSMHFAPTVGVTALQ